LVFKKKQRETPAPETLPPPPPHAGSFCRRLLVFFCKRANISFFFFLLFVIWSDKTVVWEIRFCWRQLFVLRFVSVGQPVQSVLQPLAFRLRCVRCRTDGTCGASRDWQVELKLIICDDVINEGRSVMLSVTLVVGGVLLFWRCGLENKQRDVT